MKIIACVDANGGIGYKGDLLVRLRTDHEHFYKETIGKTILYGHNTLRTLPDGKPLPGRSNVILTHYNTLDAPGAVFVHSVEEALRTLPRDTIICGGESVYAQFLPYIDELVLTELHEPLTADAFFPSKEEFKPIKRVGFPLFDIVTYRREDAL